MNAVVAGSAQRNGNTSSTLSATNARVANASTLASNLGQRRFRDLLFRLRAMTAGILA